MISPNSASVLTSYFCLFLGPEIDQHLLRNTLQDLHVNSALRLNLKFRSGI